jgi:hypothetical protein
MAARLLCFIKFSGAICRPLSYYVGPPYPHVKAKRLEKLKGERERGRVFKALRSGTLAANAPEVKRAERGTKLEAVEVCAGRCAQRKKLIPPNHSPLKRWRCAVR